MMNVRYIIRSNIGLSNFTTCKYSLHKCS